MRVYRKVMGVVVIVVACVLVGAAYQLWKGTRLAKPAQTTFPIQDELPIPEELLNLRDLRVCDVLVEPLPDALKGSLTREDIEKWTANRLKNMGIRVVSLEEQINALGDPLADEEMPPVIDTDGVHVSVDVAAPCMARGVICVNVGLSVGLTYPDCFIIASVWNKEMHAHIGAGDDPKQVIREKLNKLLDLLEKDWKQCNR
jgi:hypothetical protein